MSANIQIPTGMAGWVKVQKFKDGVETFCTEFPNLILNSGLDRFCYNPGATLQESIGRCSVGSNNTAPAAGQTLLLSPLGSTTTATDLGTTYVPGVTPYVQRSIQYDFAVGAIVGNVAEVGIGYGTYNVTPLVSRALVLDGGGVPTTVSVLITESLRVTYYLRNYIYTADTAGVVTIGGINYNYVVRAAGWSLSNVISGGLAGSWNGVSGKIGGSWVFVGSVNLTSYGVSGVGQIGIYSTQTLNTIDLTPANTGGAVGGGSSVAAAYTNGDYYRDVTFTIGLTEANSLTGGIGAVVYGGSFGVYQISFTPKLPKTALNAFALTFRITLSNYP